MVFKIAILILPQGSWSYTEFLDDTLFLCETPRHALHADTPWLISSIKNYSNTGMSVMVILIDTNIILDYKLVTAKHYLNLPTQLRTVRPKVGGRRKGRRGLISNEKSSND